MSHADSRDHHRRRRGNRSDDSPVRPLLRPVRGLDLVWSALTGAALVLSLPPPGWWVFGPFGLAGFAVLIRGRSVRGRFVLGAVGGAVYFGVALSWSLAFSVLGGFLLVMLEAGFLATTFVITPGGRLFAFPAAVVLAEAARTRWPFGGLPLGGIALGQVEGPLASVAVLGGALLVVLVTGLAGIALASAFTHRRRAALAPIVLVVAAVVAGWAAPDGDARREIGVAAVQGGGPRGVPGIEADTTAVLERHLEATRQVDQPVDLVVWPEDVVEVDGEFRREPEARELAALARDLGATLVVGVVEGSGPDAFRNAAIAFTPEGVLADRYDKVHRVPFGEYIPGRAILDRLVDLSLVPRDARPGRGPGVLETPAGRLGVLISYEVFFSDRARAAVRAGAGIIVVPTNAASFTSRLVPAQEVAAAQLRAIETGRFVVQAAPTGYSVMVTPSGRVLARSPLAAAAVLQRPLAIRAGDTPYSSLGDNPLILISALWLMSSWISGRRRSSMEGSSRLIRIFLPD